MAPPVHVFDVSQLPSKIQQDATGRRRKLDDGKRRVELEDCELLQMVQFRCEVSDPRQSNSTLGCFPVQRLFRRCQDKKGTFTVETTAWEGNDQTFQSTEASDGTKDAV